MGLLSFGDTGWGDEMALAALMTLALSTCAFSVGLVFGTVGATAKLSRFKVLRGLADAYTTVFRGIPELLVIYLFFFGSSAAIMFVARMFGYGDYIELNNFTIGVLAIAIISGAYSTEAIRGAVLAIPKGEIEAAKAAGMNDWLLFRRIMIPQTLRFALPTLGNVWLSTMKETALIMVTGLTEIMRQAHVAAGSTRAPFVFYVLAACLFLVLTTFSGYGFRRAERWALRGVRQV